MGLLQGPNKTNFAFRSIAEKPYTKLDWTLWTATLTQTPADFAGALVQNPVSLFLNKKPSRVPMT